eukprot:CAMPEP_0168510896 /NCGR_PEP_ID=MMETSP0405-20121227/1760_1 /TAXON_ID=498012 /ORGANISM="Trichosphaerium sp, Strain Am-I-7 wt" /LENGTH=176 /DNA_ID=CAMNT_0008528865 /DNA_START=608 /DNA_END=1135 /DNA_ORIENTATION=+
MGGHGLMRYWPYTLQNLEPNFSWAWSKFSNMTKQSHQLALLQCIESIFPHKVVLEEQIIALQLRRGSLTVDIYVPEHNLAFEYQGQQHYDDVYKWNVSSIQTIRDSEKKQHCEEAGICLVAIPYWWKKGDADSIIATINHYKPELNFKVKEGVEPLIEVPQSLTNSKLMAPAQLVQ